MKDPKWMRDKLRALAIEADEMLGSCDASDILDTLEEARNAMTEGAEVIASLMDQLQYSKDGLAVLLDEARKREAELAQVKRERDAAVAYLEMLADCETCAHSDDDACEHCCDYIIRGNWRWRGGAGGGGR